MTRADQQTLPFRRSHGGRRAGAGRRPKGDQAGVSHRQRKALAPWFDGFRESFTVRGIEVVVRPITEPRLWMLRTGWRRHGLLRVYDIPAARARPGA